MVARTLSRYDLDILWIEKEADICTGATSANSAIVHGGYAAPPGTVKAEMNVRATRCGTQLADELNFGFGRCGTYVVAIGDEERASAATNRPRVATPTASPSEIISGERCAEREPMVNPETAARSTVPSAASVIPGAPPSPPPKTP